MRTTIPKPFRRPSIDLGRSARVWGDIPARDVAVGDTVANYGLVSAVRDHGTASAITVGVHGEVLFAPLHSLYVFHVPDGQAGF